MKKKADTQPIFKPYHQNQVELLPPSLDDLVPSGHLVRTVNQIIDQMNIDKIFATYKGGGTSSYHPRMLLKVIVYGYTQKVYSSRRLAKAVREQIPFMWLAGGNRPDFRTLNNFRSSRLKGHINDIFKTLIELLLDAGLVKLEDYFLDGTKIESRANRYSFVWKKSTANYEAKLQSKLRTLLKEIDRTNDDENERYGDRDLEELGEDSHVSSDQIKKTLQKLEKKLSLQPDNKQLKKTVKVVKKDLLPRQQKYEQQRETLNGRNSFSKTDPDATFMRMKDDHMQNGQLKPGYNIQTGVSDQFILHYSIHQNPSDASLLKPHFESFKASYNRMPDTVIADAGYGSEENYEYLEHNKTTAYVKYPGFYREEQRKYRKNPFLPRNLYYNAKTDVYMCPAGKRFNFIEEQKRQSSTGYESTYRVYRCEGCTGCPLRVQCHKGQGDRVININVRLNELRRQARKMLDSGVGKTYRGRRLAEVESVFAQVKNRSFRRFTIWGLKGAAVEFGLAAMAHNIMKLGEIMKSKGGDRTTFLSFGEISNFLCFETI